MCFWQDSYSGILRMEVKRKDIHAVTELGVPYTERKTPGQVLKLLYLDFPDCELQAFFKVQLLRGKKSCRQDFNRC